MGALLVSVPCRRRVTAGGLEPLATQVTPGPLRAVAPEARLAVKLHNVFLRLGERARHRRRRPRPTHHFSRYPAPTFACDLAAVCVGVFEQRKRFLNVRQLL